MEMDRRKGANMAGKYSDEELTRRVKSPGWQLKGHIEEGPVRGTLEHVLKESHARRQSGKSHGLIQELETTIELDMIQIEKLWRYLGLPV
jgi:hypothetical protein